MYRTIHSATRRHDRLTASVEAEAHAGRIRRLLALAAVLSLGSGVEPLGVAGAETIVAEGARGGLSPTDDAAHIWSADAFLVYVENDAEVDTLGRSGRWGYLYFSPSRSETRVYSVSGGRIRLAENPQVHLEAPPVAADWIDSGAALAAAERLAGTDFRATEGGSPSTMLLTRGIFHDGDPNRTTWTVVYTAPGKPSLFVVVDARTGDVRRTWRG
jgi:hypothetical protein